MGRVRRPTTEMQDRLQSFGSMDVQWIHLHVKQSENCLVSEF